MKTKLLNSLLAGLCIFATTSCNNNASNSNSAADNSTTNSGCNTVCSVDVTLDDINAALNDNEQLNMAFANAVAVIPFNHINGPRNEWKFYAFVNFQFKEKKYVKYQVTYLSCTCRAANVNYWQTAYVEINLPTDGQTADDVTLKKLSFDKDGTDHYTAGFWGDSSPIYDEATGSEVIATYERVDANTPSIKEDFIPLLIGKSKTQFDAYSTTDEMTEKINEMDVADYFAGASVSTNNIIRILQSLFAYHAETFCK